MLYIEEEEEEEVAAAVARAENSDSEDSEFIPGSNSSDDSEGDNDSSRSDEDDDMENLLFELSDMSNFWPFAALQNWLGWHGREIIKGVRVLAVRVSVISVVETYEDKSLTLNCSSCDANMLASDVAVFI